MTAPTERGRWNRGTALMALVLLAAPSAGAHDGGGVYHVDPAGVDDPRGGSRARPFRTIAFALKRVPDGATISVAPGLHRGRVGVERRFEKGVMVRAAIPYRAQLRNNGKVFSCDRCAGITLEGFDIAHDDPGARALVMQIDGGGDGSARRVVIRNNVIHDSFNNDLLKINNGARDVLVQGNVFYNQSGRDEHIDINSVEDVIVEDNVFFNDFAGSGRPARADTGSFVVIKDSNGDEDLFLGSRRVTVRRNVFLGWNGGRAYGFLLVGEDGKPYPEAQEVLVENNLFLGDSTCSMRAPFGVKGARRIDFRNNTIVGDTPANAFAFRLNREGENPVVDEIRFANNIWAAPTGTLTDFADAAPDDVGRVTLSHNLYWNGGLPVPVGRDDAVNHTSDRARIVADPMLPPVTGAIGPRWWPERGHFAGGARTIAGARLALIERHARPGGRVERADPAQASRDDIRGLPRGDRPAVGAFETSPAPVAQRRR